MLTSITTTVTVIFRLWFVIHLWLVVYLVLLLQLEIMQRLVLYQLQDTTMNRSNVSKKWQDL